MSDPDESRARRRSWTRRARVAAFVLLFLVPMAVGGVVSVLLLAAGAVEIVRECTCTCRGLDAAR